MFDTTTVLRGVLAVRHEELVREQRRHRLVTEIRAARRRTRGRVTP